MTDDCTGIVVLGPLPALVVLGIPPELPPMVVEGVKPVTATAWGGGYDPSVSYFSAGPDIVFRLQG